MRRGHKRVYRNEGATVKPNTDSMLGWALGAKTGERLVYAHRNHSAAEPVPASAMFEAYRAHSMGLVFLAQRRNSHGWDYEMTRINQDTARLLGTWPITRN